MEAWKIRTKEMYFQQKMNINDIAAETGISRQSISGYLKTLPDFYDEKLKRKIENQAKRKVYKREKNRVYREEYRNRVTTETLKREHDMAVMELSHEKYH